MVCTLMHKRLAVAELELDEATGFIQRIDNVLMPEHLPVGTCSFNGTVDRAALNEWWTDRSIPASRSGIREALETLDVAITMQGTGIALRSLSATGFCMQRSQYCWLFLQCLSIVRKGKAGIS